MVAKDPESPYVAGRTLKWLTIPIVGEALAAA
jgi:hypothetical protein